MVKRLVHISYVCILSSCFVILLSTCGENPVCVGGGSIAPVFDVSLQVANNGTVYLGAKYNTTHVQDVYALNGRTGSTQWHSSIKNGGYSYASSALFVGSQALLLGPQPQQGTQLCAALRTSDGKQLWSTNCTKLLLQNNVLYKVQYGNTLTAMDVADASHPAVLLWQAMTSVDVNALSIDNGVLYVSGPVYPHTIQEQIGLAAFRVRDGALLWQFVQPLDPSKDGFRAPVVAHNIVFVTVGTSTSSSVYALRATDGVVLWRYQKPDIEDVVVGPENIVYIDWSQSGKMHFTLEALRADVGTHLWTRPDTITDNAFATNGALYVEEEDTGVYALRSSDGNMLWKTPPLYVMVAITADALYVWFDDYTFASLRLTDGSLRWRTTIADVTSVMKVSDNVVYLANIHDNGCNSAPTPGVTALKASNGQHLWHFQPSRNVPTGF